MTTLEDKKRARENARFIKYNAKTSEEKREFHRVKPVKNPRPKKEVIKISGNFESNKHFHGNPFFADNSTFGDNCTFGSNSTFGDNCTFGNNCTFGVYSSRLYKEIKFTIENGKKIIQKELSQNWDKGAQMHGFITFGKNCKIGDNALFGGGVIFGTRYPNPTSNCTIGNNPVFAMNYTSFGKITIGKNIRIVDEKKCKMIIYD